MKKGMRNCAKALAFAMAVAIFCPVNAGAATVNESKPMVSSSSVKRTLKMPVQHLPHRHFFVRIRSAEPVEAHDHHAEDKTFILLLPEWRPDSHL